MQTTHIFCDAEIVYENGAVVKTAFVTSLGGDVVAQTSPELARQLKAACKSLQREKKVELPKFDYPDHVLTAAMLQRYAKYGIQIDIRRDECMFIRRLQAQKHEKKAIYGGGLLLSSAKAAEKAAAEKAAAGRAAAGRAAAVQWELSDTEKLLIEEMDTK